MTISFNNTASASTVAPFSTITNNTKTNTKTMTITKAQRKSIIAQLISEGNCTKTVKQIVDVKVERVSGKKAKSNSKCKTVVRRTPAPGRAVRCNTCPK